MKSRSFVPSLRLLPCLHEYREALEIKMVRVRWQRRHFKAANQVVEQFARRHAARRLPQALQHTHQFRQTCAHTRKRQLALHRIEFLGKRPAMIFLRAFRQPDQIARLKTPVRRCQHPRACHVVRRNRDQPQVRQQIAHNRARKYRESS